MSRNPFRKSVGFYEVMATSFTESGDSVCRKTNQMETRYSPPAKTQPQESPKNVGFDLKDQHKENKKKYLTAKYGPHQMLLIKKRLNVEMWIFDELGKLYDCESDDHDCELELEEILNFETDSERREYAMKQLVGARQSPQLVHNFVEELLKRAGTL